MTDRLFEGSWYHAWQSVIQRAVAEVESLDRRLFSDPALGGALQRIVENYSVEIARLTTDPNSIMADPIEEERYVDDWGDRRPVKIKKLRVTIPFTGEAESLKIAPSRSKIPSHRAEIARNSLTITIPDDGHADRRSRPSASKCRAISMRSGKNMSAANLSLSRRCPKPRRGARPR